MSGSWNDEASSILKSILKRKKIKYAKLCKLLNDNGIEETTASITSKLNRGTFSFTFFIQCMNVMGINKINLD